ncbi:MAG: hypothetical protein C4543_09590 [Ignavibacteriales bacterium]|jgi:endonuclease I|nr:MAG: hypothetical protein C4543_09590 [Ignavibacteriales bacterium]
MRLIIKRILSLIIIFGLLFTSFACNKTESYDQGIYLSEDQTRQALATTDLAIGSQSKLKLIYTNERVDKTWDSGTTYNREHIWPESKLKSTKQKVDLHNIRASNPSVNLSRANYPFANKLDGGSYGLIAPENITFYPGEDDCGDVARIIMYMYVVYEKTLKIEDVIVDENLLLVWHEVDPVDDFEIARNDRIANDTLQGNRNPFIDDPDLAYVYFGDNDLNIGYIWLIGFIVYVGAVVYITFYQKNHRNKSLKDATSLMILYTIIISFIWNWWLTLLMIIIVSGLYNYLKKRNCNN